MGRGWGGVLLGAARGVGPDSPPASQPLPGARVLRGFRGFNAATATPQPCPEHVFYEVFVGFYYDFSRDDHFAVPRITKNTPKFTFFYVNYGFLLANFKKHVKILHFFA